MRFFSYLVTLLAVALLASCGGGGGSPGTIQNSVDFFSTAPAALTLTLGNAKSFSLGGGTGPYSAVSNDSSVTVAGVTGSTVTLGAVKPGIATVTLTDSKGASIKTAVTVQPPRSLFEQIPSLLTMAVGAAGAQTYAVGGGVPPYTVVNSNPTVLSAVLNANGDAITLTGLAPGEAKLVGITDSTGATVVSDVTVTATSGVALFTTAPSLVTLGTKSNTTYSIGGGSTPYVVTSSNESVATVSQSGSNFTIHAVGIGSASVVIRDSAGTVVTVTVTVQNTQLSLNPEKASAFIGDTLYANIIGGVGPYTALSSFLGAATPSIGTLSTTTGIFTPDSNGNVLKIVVNQAVSPDQIVVTDSLGNSANFALTATPGTSQISLIPGQLTISACYGGDVTLLLYGSSGNVNVFSSDTTVFTAAAGSSSSSPVVVTATRVAASVHPDLGGDVTITAIDAAGSSATSTITIVPAAAATCP